ncbi:MAG: hypothetical protein AAGA32_02360 [Pseudomonadota bacterium]
MAATDQKPGPRTKLSSGGHPYSVRVTLGERRHHAAQAQASDEGGLAVAARYARAAPTPPAAMGPVGSRPRFVDGETPLGIEIGLGVDPGAATAQNGRVVLLARQCPRTDGGSMPRLAPVSGETIHRIVS